MQGRKNFKDEKELRFSLSAHVPEHNFYRRLKQQLNLDFLYELTRPFYGRCGQHSIDPVVFFKLCLVSYLENIPFDRRLMEHCSLRLDLLYFLGYQLDEPLPWHSTLSRTRQLYPEALFEALFDRVFSLCVEKGMVKGDIQVLDSAPIKANASMESLLLKKPAVSAENQEKKMEVNANSSSTHFITAPDHQLKRLERRQQRLNERPSGAIGSSNDKAQLLNIKTHYSVLYIPVLGGRTEALTSACSLAPVRLLPLIIFLQWLLSDTMARLFMELWKNEFTLGYNSKNLILF